MQRRGGEGGRDASVPVASGSRPAATHCIKLSTYGVKPMDTLITVAMVRQRTPEPLRVQRAQKLTSTSAQLAPIRPKTEADAPTESTPGRKTMETSVPKMPATRYSSPMRQKPKARSSSPPTTLRREADAQRMGARQVRCGACALACARSRQGA